MKGVQKKLNCNDLLIRPKFTSSFGLNQWPYIIEGIRTPGFALG
jgi:hypothetical protein